MTATEAKARPRAESEDGRKSLRTFCGPGPGVALALQELRLRGGANFFSPVGWKSRRRVRAFQTGGVARAERTPSTP